ncbi:hypothetical protein CHL78_012240 [Romboutsia weinsteinii]|uniref:Uncharacterized protein n=1 Tax=Romboutsia weinsteinii TaxID=2020949 RepID=A0A371J1X2_9FIRM|nr:hypothetical protein [Romboutsia weinsteinii]RDY26715.1 hypothetical protein CHL78_012240 [Romboutsia weinsteinii]
MKIKKVLLTIMGVSCIGLLGMSAVGCSNVKNDPSTLKGAYFNITETYENNDVVNSNELIKNLSEAKLKRTKDSVELETYENDGSQSEYTTSKYEFKKGNEVFQVEYIGDDTKEPELENLYSAYYSILKDGSENAYLNMYYSEPIDGRLFLDMYLDSVEEQREVTNLIYDNKEISNMYKVYYKIAQSIEDDSKITIPEIEELLENKKLEKFDDYYKDANPNLESYTYTQGGLTMDIVYDGKENQCYQIILEDIESGKVSLYYYKGMSYGIQLKKINKDYKEQEAIVNKLMEKRASDEK